MVLILLRQMVMVCLALARIMVTVLHPQVTVQVAAFIALLVQELQETEFMLSLYQPQGTVFQHSAQPQVMEY
jgi:hypothetical protein